MFESLLFLSLALLSRCVLHDFLHSSSCSGFPDICGAENAPVRRGTWRKAAVCSPADSPARHHRGAQGMSDSCSSLFGRGKCICRSPTRALASEAPAADLCSLIKTPAYTQRGPCVGTHCVLHPPRSCTRDLLSATFTLLVRDTQGARGCQKFPSLAVTHFARHHLPATTKPLQQQIKRQPRAGSLHAQHHAGLQQTSCH